MLQDKRRRLLGHVMRAADTDPLYQVTFEEYGFNRYEKPRVGRPRGHWAKTTMNETMNWLEGADFDYTDEVGYLVLFSAAIERKF